MDTEAGVWLPVFYSSKVGNQGLTKLLKNNTTTIVIISLLRKNVFKASQKSFKTSVIKLQLWHCYSEAVTRMRSMG